jgi:hypothetical protein
MHGEEREGETSIRERGKEREEREKETSKGFFPPRT